MLAREAAVNYAGRDGRTMTGAANSLIGAELGSRFTDLRVLRAGSRFTIYEGRELGANRMIVVKVPDHGSPWLNDVIEREAEVLAAISSHPHVVTLYQRITLDDGRPALLLERCLGTLYDSVHGDDEAMSVQEVVATGIKLAATYNPVFGTAATYVRGVVETVASARKNRAITDAHIGLTNEPGEISLPLVEGTYVFFQPLSTTDTIMDHHPRFDVDKLRIVTDQGTFDRNHMFIRLKANT